jgi:hypothetical protein
MKDRMIIIRGNEILILVIAQPQFTTALKYRKLAFSNSKNQR